MDKDNKHHESKLSVIIIGILVVIYAVLYGGFCIFMYQDIEHPFMLFYGLIPLSILVGIIIAVKMRIKEISKGEIYEASKY